MAVYRAASEVEANLIKGLLENHGVPATVSPNTLATVLGGLGDYQVLVPQNLANLARELLATDGTA